MSSLKITNLFNRLKYSKNKRKYLTPSYLRDFCRDQSMHTPNTQNKVINAKIFWHTFKVNGFEIQSHIFANNCRILSPKGKRLAWGTDDMVLSPLLRYVNERNHLNNCPPSEYGLVLCGGGAKGAYQIGVWKYLRENGIDKKINGISGSSVGSLNALLIANNSFGPGIRTWLNAKSNVLTDQNKLAELIWQNISDWKNIISDKWNLYADVSKIAPLNDYNKPYEVLRHYISKTEYFCMSCMTPEEIVQTVLASAALPAVYPPVKINGRIYIDGGITDNIPVAPLVKAGYKKIIIVHLDPESENEDKRFINAIHRLDISDIKFIHIYPSEDLTPIDMFTLNRSHTEKLIRLGYKDAQSDQSTTS